MCKRCSDPSCLVCNVNGCLICEPNKALHEAKCEIAQLIDYQLIQFYDPKSPHTFNLRIILEDRENVSSLTYQEFSKSILDYKDKFKVAIPSITGELDIKIEKSIKNSNLFIMRVIPKDITGLYIGDKFEMIIDSYSKSLDPQKTALPSVYLLKQKSTKILVQVYKLTRSLLGSTSDSVAKITAKTNEIAWPATLGLGILLTFYSDDLLLLFLKFNQFLSLVRRIKLIGLFFGSSLEEFIDIISGSEANKTRMITKLLRRGCSRSL